MLFFYKYLLKHGEEDGSPLIDKDLFFYIEVQKFKVSTGNLNRGILYILVFEGFLNFIFSIDINKFSCPCCNVLYSTYYKQI